MRTNVQRFMVDHKNVVWQKVKSEAGGQKQKNNP